MICEWCQKEIPWKKRYQYPSQRPRTCSQSCGGKLAHKEGKGRQKTKRICELCGKEHTGKHRTCSRSCGARLAIKEGRWHLPNPPNSYGPSNTNWKGGQKRTKAGYVYVLAPTGHPREYRKNGRRRYLAEHRIVMEKHIGRVLEDWEQVHHKNGIKDDNRIGNLQLVSLKKHLGEVTCPHCHKTFLIH